MALKPSTLGAGLNCHPAKQDHCYFYHMVKITEDIWYWHPNVSECYYHIQLTIKYRRSVFEEEIKTEMQSILKGFKERYYIDVHTIGYDENHVHIYCQNIQEVRWLLYWDSK